MNLYESIAQRKSCRKYDLKPLGQDKLAEIDGMIKNCESLYPEISLSWRFITRVKGRFHVEAPHYLIVSGQGKAGETENVGYLFEQLVLWFDAMEIGCVWLGSSKDGEAANTENDIITIGFGQTAEPVHRSKDQFKRKPIDKITNAPEDVRMQAVHLAPSGMNTQPWYFEQQDSRVAIYKQKLKPPISLLYKHSDVDMGIALCHFALACKETDRLFHFSRSSDLPDKPGYMPFGVIE